MPMSLYNVMSSLSKRRSNHGLFFVRHPRAGFCLVGTYVALSELDRYGPDSTHDTWVDHPMIPAAIAGFVAVFVTGCFMDVYDGAIQTLLLSFCLDEDKFKNGAFVQAGQPLEPGTSFWPTAVHGIVKCIPSHKVPTRFAVCVLVLGPTTHTGLYKKKLDAQGNPDPRMFCELNDKSGLMQMVNGGSKKDSKSQAKQHKKAKEKHEDAKEAAKEQPSQPRP
eukprot:SAG22_NODE_1333_length_4674_cov_5.765319_3_plen_221_part_00